MTESITNGQPEQILSRHGELGSFVVHVRHRQNSTWQGSITWVEENRTVNFRSVWEMVRLMENALEKTAPDMEKTERSDWEK